MAKHHSFNQVEIFMLETRIGQKYKDKMWEHFIRTANAFGFKVRVTGGNFITHDITCDQDDFNTILEITKDTII